MVLQRSEFVKIINLDEFNERLQEKHPQVILFTGEHCPKCQDMFHIFSNTAEEYAEEFFDLKFLSIDINQNEINKKVVKSQLTKLPALVYFEDGKE